MALRVWLPLNGNLENKGLSNVIVTNSEATVDNNGKIGQTYSFDANLSFISIDGDEIRNVFKGGSNPFTITVWLYNTKTSGTRAVPFGDYGLTGTMQFNLELNSSAGNWNDDIRFYWGGNPDYRATGTSITPNTWVHLAIVYDGTQLEFYRNGILVNTRIGELSTKNKTIGVFNLGRDSRTGNTIAFGGKINDFRVYDEALSQKQIKEISKGLIAHYKFEGIGANENLLLHAEKYTISNPRVESGTAKDIYHTLGIYYNGLDTSKYYVYSVCSDGNLASKHQGGQDPANRLWTVWLYYSNTAYSDSSYTTYDNPKCYTSADASYVGHIGNRYYWRFKPSYPNCSVRVNTYGNDTDTVTVNFWDFKLEEGEKLTDWIPNKYDDLYMNLKYDDMITTDCSGYGYNGTISGDLKYSLETPRYDGSTYFENGTDFMKTDLSISAMPELSVSFWVKPNTSNGNYCCIMSPYNNPVAAGLWIAINCEGCGLWAYRAAYAAGASLLTNGTWYHAVYTFKDGVSKWYLNGVQQTLTKNNYTGTTMPLLDVTIGNSYPGTSWNTKNYSSISDFRIYATALSENDIKELYQTSAIVDNKGNAYAYEFKEAD